MFNQVPSFVSFSAPASSRARRPPILIIVGWGGIFMRTCFSIWHPLPLRPKRPCITTINEMGSWVGG
eukprot:190538-Karenia_brevis.AAC.1